MDAVDMSRASWRKSTRSNGQDACVEVASTPTTVAIRDSKDPQSAILRIPAARWRVFLDATKRGAFDLTTE